MKKIKKNIKSTKSTKVQKLKKQTWAPAISTKKQNRVNTQKAKRYKKV